MELQRIKHENEVLRGIVTEKNQEIAGLQAELQRARSTIGNAAEELTWTKMQHQKEMEEKAKEINELKESLIAAEYTGNIAMNILHKKQKAFEKRKTACQNLQSTVIGLNTRIKEMEMNEDMKIQQIDSLNNEVRVLKKNIVGLTAKVVANTKEDSKNKELQLESARQYKAWSMKQIATLNSEVSLARCLNETSVQARNKMRSELCKKLKSLEEELETAKKEIGRGNAQLKQQYLRIQSSEKEISELAAKNVKNNEVIQNLQEKNGELNQFVDNVKNAMGVLCLGRGTTMQNNA